MSTDTNPIGDARTTPLDDIFVIYSMDGSRCSSQDNDVFHPRQV